MEEEEEEEEAESNDKDGESGDVEVRCNEVAGFNPESGFLTISNCIFKAVGVLVVWSFLCVEYETCPLASAGVICTAYKNFSLLMKILSLKNNRPFGVLWDSCAQCLCS